MYISIQIITACGKRSLISQKRCFIQAGWMNISGKSMADLSMSFIAMKQNCGFRSITRSTCRRKSWGKNLKDGVPGMLEGIEKNRMLFRKYRMLAEKEKKVIFGGRMFYEGSYGIDEAVRDAIILAEKYAGKKMPDRNVCQAPEA